PHHALPAGTPPRLAGTPHDRRPARRRLARPDAARRRADRRPRGRAVRVERDGAAVRRVLAVPAAGRVVAGGEARHLRSRTRPGRPGLLRGRDTGPRPRRSSRGPAREGRGLRRTLPRARPMPRRRPAGPPRRRTACLIGRNTLVAVPIRSSDSASPTSRMPAAPTTTAPAPNPASAPPRTEQALRAAARAALEDARRRTLALTDCLDS